MDRNNIQDILALTPVQEGILFHYLENPGQGHYVEQLTLEIEGELDILQVEKAWNLVIENNPALRSCFRWKKLDNPVQVILKQQAIRLRYMEFSYRDGMTERPEGVGEKGFIAYKRQDREKAFFLEEVPFRVSLCRLGLCRYMMLISHHHILYDGWSSSLLLEEFFSVYHSLLCEQIPQSVVRPDFKSFIQWIRNRDTEGERSYWQNYFRGFNPGEQERLSIQLPDGEEAGFADVAPSISVISVVLPDHGSGMLTRERLKVFASGHQVTVAVLFYAAWGLLLQRYNRQSDILFGTSVSGRQAPLHGINMMTGMLINTLPFRFKTTGHESVPLLLTHTAHCLGEQEPFSHTPLLAIKEYSGMEGEGELFDTLLVVENYPLEFGAFKFSALAPFFVCSGQVDEATHYDLTNTISLFSQAEPVLTVSYRSRLFEATSVSRLVDHFVFLLEDMIKNPWKNINVLEMISPDEKREILVTFNRTDAFYPSQTLHGLFEEQVERTPGYIAVVSSCQPENFADRAGEPGGVKLFSTGKRSKRTGKKGNGEMYLSYRALNERSQRLAGFLRAKGAGPGMIVALFLERSSDMIMAVLAILKTGAAYLPIDTTSPSNRVDYILADSQAVLLLDERMITSALVANSSFTGSPHRQATGVLNTSPNLHWLIENESEKGIHLAYVIYTSGSTGQPKGVMVEHRSAVNLIWSMQRIYPVERFEGYMFKTPYIFDVSVTELFGWYMGGGRSVVLERGGEREPQRILETIGRHGVSHINFVPSLFNLFVDHLERIAGEMESFKILKSIKMVFLAGEELLSEWVVRFRRLPLPRQIRLVNLYGPTETTVYASWYSLSQWDGRGRIPIGTPLPNMRLYILDRTGSIQPVGIAGELGVSGEGLACGYLNRQELTGETFVRLKKSSWIHPDSDAIKWSSFQLTLKVNRSHFTLYKTGDLARWQSSGVIEFLGRMDRQVKIRGIRIEPGEIESCLMQHEQVREVVVMARAQGNEDRVLCAYIVSRDISGAMDSTAIAEELQEFLGYRLPRYMIPTRFIILEQMPTTGGGKINRRALAGIEYQSHHREQPPATVLEAALVSLWRGVLYPAAGDPRSGLAIGIDDHFFQLGGHSLKAVSLIGRIHKTLDIEITLAEVFKNPTIRSQAELLEAKKKQVFKPIEPAEEREYYPLSLAQQRIYLWQMLESNGTAYNLPVIFKIEGAGPGEKEKLERAMGILVERHDGLRTSFRMKGNCPVQVIHSQSEVVFSLEYYEVGTRFWAGGDLGFEVEDVIGTFVRPFDLSQAPLLRVGYVHRWDGGEPLVMLDLHHLVADGVSLSILAQEFLQLYRGEILGPVSLQYKDFVQWQSSIEEQERVDQQGQYWLSRYRPGVMGLNLPLDFSRPLVQRYEGRVKPFEIPAETVLSLKRFAVKEGASLYMVLLAIYYVLLYKMTGCQDIVVGTSMMGRRHNDLNSMIGLFFQTLALRNFLRGSDSFSQFLKQLKEDFMEAFANQDYPFDRLVQELMERGIVKKDPSRNALFSTMFAWQNFDIPELVTGGIRLVPYPYEQRTAKFDLFPMAQEVGDMIEIRLEYATVLFKPETIDKIIRWFLEIIDQVVDDPAIRLDDIHFTTHLVEAGTGTGLDEFTAFRF